MAWLRRIGVLSLVGLVLGVLVASLISPAYLAWYITPGAGQAFCNCVEVVKSTAESLLRAQVIGALAGSLLGCGVGLLWRPKAKSVTP